MEKRDVVELALAGKEVPYIPWAISFTQDSAVKLQNHLGIENAYEYCDNCVQFIGSTLPETDMGGEQYKDIFGVTWDKSEDKGIGVVAHDILTESNFDNYEFPDPLSTCDYKAVKKCIDDNPDKYKVFAINFSLYERAWSLRGMVNLMMDYYDNPEFVHELFGKIADFNIAKIKKALEYDIDAVYFGDDWGQQKGLIMGPDIWREFIKPYLVRMYSVVKDAGKKVFIHSCGDVDELFDDLVEIGLDCFNPFQPEAMKIFPLMEEYKGKLSFHGGLSTQVTLPYGTVEDVQRETNALLEAGKSGNYIFGPAHTVPEDVSVENMMAFLDIIHGQEGYKKV